MTTVYTPTPQQALQSARSAVYLQVFFKLSLLSN